MSQRRIIIGDVHGHYGALMTLLEVIAPTEDDYLYFLGDLIDR
ncbi:MAG: metallophosphoesterase, partial [Microcystaceae cyanobacterium]